MGEVVWTEAALDDVQEIVRFVSKNSPGYAAQLGARFGDATRILRDEPRTGWQLPELDVDEVRELLVRPYRLVYVIREHTCHVAAVLHASRDITRVLRQRGIGRK